jgi:subtilisin family serine protease
MPVKIGRCSDGALTGGYDGIVWAANNGADVINMSWGGPGSGTYGQNVINDAWNLGSILVAAAGNDGVSTQFYPAAYNNVVSVASTAQNDQKSGFSQYGTWIDISAPGSNILSTNESTGYANSSGTSMASPVVAGVSALLRSYFPELTAKQVKEILMESSTKIDMEVKKPGTQDLVPFSSLSVSGGTVNAYEAVKLAMETKGKKKTKKGA